jgi:multifunctional methyltransferase subunit TRM112
MRIITHNMLQCHKKGCSGNNFPLLIKDAEIDQEEDSSDFSADFLIRMMDRIDWPALVSTSHALGIAILPESKPDSPDEALLKQLHHVLLESRVLNGKLVCPGCERVYPIIDSIPNMLLTEDEV